MTPEHRPSRTKRFALSVFLILPALWAGLYFFSARMLYPPKNRAARERAMLKHKAKRPYRLSLDLETITGSRTVRVIGGGNLVLPGGFRETPEGTIRILHGTRFEELDRFLRSPSFRKAPPRDRPVVITSLALKRCLLEPENPVLAPYLDRFMKSGDIFSDEGKRFYYLDRLTFRVQDNLAGIILQFPEDRYFSRVMNYGLAHLIQNDFSLEGLQNPVRFLETIHFPKPSGFEGSFEELVRLAREEYHGKFLANILSLDSRSGKVVPRKLLPFGAPKRSRKILPCIRAVRLAPGVYFSGLSPAGREPAFDS